MTYLRSAAVPLYLLACILLGGSAQGVLSNLAVQLLGLAILAWAALAHGLMPERISSLEWLIIAALAVLLLQLIPVPPAVWTEFPWRLSVEQGFQLTGEQLPWLPISLDPARTVFTIFAVIPALALYAAVRNLHPSPQLIAAAIVTGTVVNIALGAVQVSSGGKSWAYFYHFTNNGAVGSFANQNHMGTLLLVSIPFFVGLLLAWQPRRRDQRQAKLIAAVSGFALLGVGIILNGSTAVFGLLMPVALASAALAPSLPRWRNLLLSGAVVSIFGAVLLLASVPVSTLERSGAQTSIQTREAIWSKTFAAIRTTFPEGTGLGTFEEVYRQYEDPTLVTSEFVNHAHNDYLELVLELGGAGLVLLSLFFGWWAFSAAAVWRTPFSTPMQRTSTIVSAAILVHSIVDYPLRTAAISGIFAVSLAWMQRNATNPTTARGKNQLRHVTI